MKRERLPALLSKLALVAVVGMLGTTGLTYAAEQRGATRVASRLAHVRPQPAVLVVPDIHDQAFVFAKGVLQDAGFAWRVAGPVAGFAPNLVVGQSPAPGTRVVDTGAPLVTVRLSRNPHYPQTGVPENSSPYRSTPVRSADSVSSLLTPYVAPRAAKPKHATGSTTKQTTTPSPAAAPAKPASARQAARVARPAAFVVAGAPKEPLDEMPLPDRARLLGQWLAKHPAKTDSEVKHWLYQNSWIVTGARFGWWHGAEALRILIGVDQRTETLWGIGTKSRLVAQKALAEVEARTR